MKKSLGHNLGLKLVSLAIGFALWVVVAGEQRDERALNVPVKFSRLPKNMALVNDPGEFVTVKLRGPKSMVSSLPPEEVDLNLDFSRLREGENLVPVRPEDIEIPRGMEVLQASPKWVRMVLEAVAEREVRIAARVEGTPAAGHFFKRASAYPDRVRVVGPRSEVNRLVRIYTSAVSIQGRSRNFSTRAALELAAKSVRVQGIDSVQVSIEIGSLSGRPAS